MGNVTWRENRLPISVRFDDPYYSRHDGRAETNHVFIDGNNLRERWPTMNQCTVAELGFGTGLNFLETVKQWTNVATSGSILKFFSFEQYPLQHNEMQQALSRWPELKTLSDRLLKLWNPTLTRFDVKFVEGVHLIVLIGDANQLLPVSDILADAWFLDGFSPAKNPELWNSDLMQEVADHTVAGGTFATYSAAGAVRRNLQDAGFNVRKTDGFGTKREMLIGNK